MYIITAISGACGDIVSAVIDSKQCSLSPIGFIYCNGYRSFFKRPNLKVEDFPKLLEMTSQRYKSVSSQYVIPLDIRKNHINILIDVTDNETLGWCNSRVNQLFGKSSIDEETLQYQIKSLRDNADVIINLREVLSGNLLTVLSQYVEGELDGEMYNQWLSLIRVKFPYNFL